MVAELLGYVTAVFKFAGAAFGVGLGIGLALCGMAVPLAIVVKLWKLKI